MTTRRRFVGAAAATLAGAALPRVALAAARPLAIGYVPSTLFAPLFVALDRGYLRDAGFAPDATPIVAGQDAMALVAQGRLDLVGAALSAAFFNAVARGFDLRFAGSTAYQPAHGAPSALLIRKDLYDAGLRTGGLKGHTIGWLGGAGAASAYYVARILRTVSLALSDVDGVNIAAPDQEVALERKAIDAVFAAAPFTELFERKGLARLAATPPPGISASGIFFGPTLLGDRGAARAALAALRRGAADVAADYAAPRNLAAYAQYTKQPVALLGAIPHYDYPPDLHPDRATLADMQRVYIAQGDLTYKDPLPESRLVAGA